MASEAFGDGDPRYAKAQQVNLGGSHGGVLSLLLGGLDNNTVRDISGGWEKSFSLASEAQVSLTFSYNLTQSANYESNEYSDVLIALDGVLFGTSGQDYVARIVGNGDGGGERSTGWVTVELDLGLQSAGSHTLALGGFNNKKTYNDESTEILFDDIHLNATTFTSNAVPLVSADFEGNSDGFSYKDDAFGTSNPGYAKGATINVGGARGGVLSLDLGGVDNSTRVDMSGGWEKGFTLSEDGETTLTFRYNLTQTANYESDEYSEVVVAVDGVLVGIGNHDYVARITGDGNGGGAKTTGWVTVELDLGVLKSGAHTVTIGGFNNKKTYGDESSNVLIDDVSITANVAIPQTTHLIDATFDSGTEGFTYRDDTFGTSRPGYANGTTIDIGGARDGVLAIEIGGQDNSKVDNMSGGWQQSFTVDSKTPATLTFMYKMTQTANYESDEFSDLRVSIDGKLVGADGKSYVARITGDGNGGASKTTGWQTVELDLGDLGSGKHTLTIGGFNNKKTYSDESTEILIDDVVVSKTGSGSGSGGSTPDPEPEPEPDPQPSGFFDAGFSSNTDGFVYRDDRFGTNNPAYGSGARVNLGGARGGVLSLELGGVDDKVVSDMSAGWEKAFNVSSQTDAKVSFRYNMTQSANYESDEFSELRVAIDGKLVDANGHAYVARLVGDGNGGSEKSTGWQTIELDLGKLGAGEHTLAIGGYNNEKTYHDESTEILIDDVSVSAGKVATGSSGGSTGGTSGGSSGSVNHAPTDITLSNDSVVKNVPGAIVGSLSVIDQDQGDSHKFTLNDNRFEVQNGILQLKNGQSLSGDATVKVTATDNGGLTYSESFKVTAESGSVYSGNVINAASGRSADVQAAINKAHAGDIVKIPAGTWEFNGEVTAPDGIHIMGAGADKTILNKTSNGDGAMFTVDVVNEQPFKFSGITLKSKGTGTVDDTGIQLRGGHTDFEIFDSKFIGLGKAGISIGGTYGSNHGTPTGVIYNNEFIDIFYPNRGYGVAIGGDEDTDNIPVQLGNDYAVIIEDNYFHDNRHAVASNNSARYVFRYNTVEGGQSNAAAIDAHGLESWPEGTKSYEIYGNTIESSSKLWAGIGIRGGDGVIYDNDISGYNEGIVLLIEDLSNGTKYPIQDQIRDLWIWDNSFNGKNTNDVSVFNNTPLIAEGRDYHIAEKSGYSAFVYPHPLRDDTVQHSTNGDDVLRGDYTDDILIGLNGKDNLKGLGGDDVLIGGSGADVLEGGAGKDAFLYATGDLGSGVDVITDFDKGKGGDILDLSDLVSGYNGSNASSFVRLVGSGGDTKVQVDVNGATNGSNYVDLVVLDGVTGLSVNNMLQDGNLVLA